MISSTSATLRSSLGIFLTRIGILPLMFASAVLVARALTSQERGSYAVLLLFNVLWLPIFSFGQWGSISYLAGNRRYAIRDIALTVSALSLLIGVFAASVLLTLWFFDGLGEIASSLPLLELTLMVSLLPLQAAQQAHTRLLLADAKYRQVNIFNLAAAVLFLGLLLSGLFLQPAMSARQLDNPLRIIVVCYAISQVTLVFFCPLRSGGRINQS